MRRPPALGPPIAWRMWTGRQWAGWESWEERPPDQSWRESQCADAWQWEAWPPPQEQSLGHRRREAWPPPQGRQAASPPQVVRLRVRAGAPPEVGKVKHQRPALDRYREGEGYIPVPAPWSLKQLPPNFYPTWKHAAIMEYGCKVSFRTRRKSEWTSWDADASEGPRNVVVVMGSHCLHFLQDFMTALAAVGVQWKDTPLVEEASEDNDDQQPLMVPITSLQVCEAEWQDSVLLQLTYTAAHRLAPIQLVGWDPEGIVYRDPELTPRPAKPQPAQPGPAQPQREQPQPAQPRPAQPLATTAGATTAGATTAGGTSYNGATTAGATAAGATTAGGTCNDGAATAGATTAGATTARATTAGATCYADSRRRSAHAGADEATQFPPGLAPPPPGSSVAPDGRMSAGSASSVQPIAIVQQQRPRDSAGPLPAFPVSSDNVWQGAAFAATGGVAPNVNGGVAPVVTGGVGSAMAAPTPPAPMPPSPPSASMPAAPGLAPSEPAPVAPVSPGHAPSKPAVREPLTAKLVEPGPVKPPLATSKSAASERAAKEAVGPKPTSTEPAPPTPADSATVHCVQEAIKRLAQLACDSVKSDRGRWHVHRQMFIATERETAERDREREGGRALRPVCSGG